MSVSYPFQLFFLVHHGTISGVALVGNGAIAMDDDIRCKHAVDDIAQCNRAGEEGSPVVFLKHTHGQRACIPGGDCLFVDHFTGFGPAVGFLLVGRASGELGSQVEGDPVRCGGGAVVGLTDDDWHLTLWSRGHAVPLGTCGGVHASVIWAKVGHVSMGV